MSPTGTMPLHAETQSGATKGSSLSLRRTNREKTAPTFTLFPQLPAELRVMIWEFAILLHNRGRLISLKLVWKDIRPVTSGMKCSPYFSASYESREVALRLYPMRIALQGTKRHARSNNSAPRYDIREESALYLSPKYDIFIMRHEPATRRARLAFEHFCSWYIVDSIKTAAIEQVVLLQPDHHNCTHIPFSYISHRRLPQPIANNPWLLDRVSFPALKSCYHAVVKDVHYRHTGLRDKEFRDFFYDRKKQPTLDGLSQWLNLVEVNGEDLEVFRSGGKVDGKCLCEYQGPRDEVQGL
ncbi:hypothetical protein F5Y18DRAFT_401917 [Xylariaceae sp. FL1019]|nr:hypothetical protein F5Y18DRAFT_401917 [Xylariaceae sp. FL1019]